MEKEGHPVAAAAAAADNTITALSKPSKKNGPLGVFLAGLFVARTNRPSPTKDQSPTTVRKTEASGIFWKRIICGVRPLHHNLDHCPVTPRATRLKPTPFSPTSSANESSSSSMSSCYSSAADLRVLDNDDNSDDNVEYGTDDGYNEIDRQAEEFIARFYEQMRLQRLESMECA